MNLKHSVTNRRVLVLSFCFAFLLLAIMSFSYAKGTDVKPTKEYVTIQVDTEDTLWSIAKSNMNTTYYNTNTYIEEVKSINNMKNDTIYAGDYLIVPRIFSK